VAHPLEAARLKIGRARERMNEIEREASAFLDTQPYVVVPHNDGEADWFTMRCRVFAPPPMSLGLVAGDFAHNLRSALDYIVYQLAALGDHGEKGRGKKTQFPIFRDVTEYERWEKVYLKGVRDQERAAIKQLQPFDRPGSLLFAIMELDDRDKHRLVDPVVSIAGAVALSPYAGTTIHEVIPTNPPSDEGLNLNDGAVLGRFRATATDGEVRVNFKLQPALAFRVSDTRAIQAREFSRVHDVAISILALFVPSFD
jgi:hypothetical protein